MHLKFEPKIWPRHRSIESTFWQMPTLSSQTLGSIWQNLAKFIFLGEIWVLGKCFLQFIQYLHTLTQAYVIFIAVKDIFKISHLFILIGAVGFYNYLKKNSFNRSSCKRFDSRSLSHSDVAAAKTLSFKITRTDVFVVAKNFSQSGKKISVYLKVKLTHLSCLLIIAKLLHQHHQYHHLFLKKWANPGLFFVYFRSFYGELHLN